MTGEGLDRGVTGIVVSGASERVWARSEASFRGSERVKRWMTQR